MDAIKKGKIGVQNPYYKKKSVEVDLSPQYVEWIVFWSRNYAPFIRHHTFFSDYNLFFHFTVLTHHPLLEKSYIPAKQAIMQVENLVNLYSADQIIWRYDPIVIWKNGQKIETNFDENNFKFLCRHFARFGLKRCYFSFVSTYKKFETKFKKKHPHLVLELDNIPRQYHILETMKLIAADFNIQLYSCCNDRFVNGGIFKGSCINGHLLNQLSNNSVSASKSPTRKGCGCTHSIDIGNYSQQPCYFGCIYCYANPVW